MTIKAGIFGATGYTGLELVGLLAAHPEVELAFATSESMAGQSLRTSWPQAPDITLISSAEAEKQDVQCVFLCLPHTQSATIAAKALAKDIRVIDLSADLRLRDVKAYEQWYGVTHPAPDLLPVPYGLPELGREALVDAKVIANPGCYATATILGVAPLVRQGLLDEHTPIIVDAKSGVTGAGRTPKLNILYGEVHGNFSPYNIGRAHRHIPEIEQALSDEGLEAGRLIFSPHLLPTDRGILATLYLQVKNIEAARQAYHDMYDDEALVNVLPAGELATLGHVVRTPHAALSLTLAGDHMLIVVSVLDNLLKGAASQAVQNFNLMWGLPETMGLIAGAQDKVTA
jgi:N-acetyl-gamma-glutamyl-phosphate reductase